MKNVLAVIMLMTLFAGTSYATDVTLFNVNHVVYQFHKETFRKNGNIIDAWVSFEEYSTVPEDQDGFQVFPLKKKERYHIIYNCVSNKALSYDSFWIQLEIQATVTMDHKENATVDPYSDLYLVLTKLCKIKK